MPKYRAFTLRPATQTDVSDVRVLIRSVNINPIGLDWRRFVVAVAPGWEIIGCGQVKIRRDGSQELASIAVTPEWRRRGVARTIIEHLISNHVGPLYLTCRARLGSFYEQFGFRIIGEDEMPRYFLWALRLFGVLKAFNLVGEDLLVMKKDLPTDV